MFTQQPSSSNVNKHPRFFYGYTIVLASFIVLMIAWGAQYSFGVFFKPVLAEFGWTRTVTSGVYSLNIVLVGFFGIFAGRLSDKFGPRAVVSVCGVLIGLGYMLMSRISAVWQIYLLYGVLISIGQAGMWVPLMSTVVRWFVKGRGLASGIAASGIGFGITVMPPLANKLISSYNWRTSYIIIGSSVLAVTLIIAQFLKRDPGQMGLPAFGSNSVNVDSQDLQVHGFSLREAIRTMQFWLICSVFFCSIFCLQTVMVHIVPHATDIGISSAAAATVLSVVGIMSIVSKIGLGSIVDRIGTKRGMIIVLVLMSISFLWLIFANQLWMLYLFAFAFGIAYGGVAAIQSPMVAEFFGLKVHGLIFGLGMFAANLGGAVGSLVAGRIFDIKGSYNWDFILCAMLCLVGLILSILLKATQKGLQKG